MDSRLLTKRFSSLVNYAMAMGIKLADPLVTHPRHGPMTIFEVLAFEFAAPVDEVRAAVQAKIGEDRSKYFFITKRRPTTSEMMKGFVKVSRVTIATSAAADDRTMMLGTRIWGPGWHVANTYKQVELAGFAAMMTSLYNLGVQVTIADRFSEWVDSGEELFEILDRPVMRQFTKVKTGYIAHTPVTWNRHFLQWPKRVAGAAHAVTIDATGHTARIAEMLDHEAANSYAGKLRVEIAEGYSVMERERVDNDLEIWATRDHGYRVMTEADHG